MDENFGLGDAIAYLGCCAFMLFPLTGLGLLGVRDPHARKDTLTLVLTSICFFPHAFVSLALVASYGFRAFGMEWFWPPFLAALATGYGVFLCVKARWT